MRPQPSSPPIGPSLPPIDPSSLPIKPFFPPFQPISSVTPKPEAPLLLKSVITSPNKDTSQQPKEESTYQYSTFNSISNYQFGSKSTNDSYSGPVTSSTEESSASVMSSLFKAIPSHSNFQPPSVPATFLGPFVASRTESTQTIYHQSQLRDEATQTIEITPMIFNESVTSTVSFA